MMEQHSNSDAPGNKLMVGGETAGQGVDAGEMGETLKRKNNLVKSFGYAASGVVQAGSERNFKVGCRGGGCGFCRVCAFAGACMGMGCGRGVRGRATRHGNREHGDRSDRRSGLA